MYDQEKKRKRERQRDNCETQRRGETTQRNEYVYIYNIFVRMVEQTITCVLICLF